MVKKMIVVLSAAALIMTIVGPAMAQMTASLATVGDMIVIPMKIKSSFTKITGRGGFSSFFMDGCEQYTGGFRPWGTWKSTRCIMKTQVIPPKCVAPATPFMAPVATSPGCKLISATEKYAINSPGCNPCVTGGLSYQMIKRTVLK
jgi:hypothetical protein